MNKSEKLICVVLGLILAWYVFTSSKQTAVTTPAEPTTMEAQSAEVQSAEVAAEATTSETTTADNAATEVGGDVLGAPLPEEQLAILENELVKLEFTTHGGALKKATLKKYALNVGEIAEDNPALEMDFSASPLGNLELNGAAMMAFEGAQVGDNTITFENEALKKTFTLKDDYKLELVEEVKGAALPANRLSLGVVKMGLSKNDLLSVDSWAIDMKGGKVVHHCEGDSPLKAYLVGGVGGCSGSSNAANMPKETVIPVPGAQKYLALKNRFFVSALASSTDTMTGFVTKVTRDMSSSSYRPEAVASAAEFAALEKTRTTLFYVGPKKQALLWDLGMKDVMEFGMWRWVCYPLVWVLNLSHSFIPSFGIAIILLTIIVRLIFWPLTHKSTVGMKKMQELQPKMKAIQEKFKDNPQRLQQETWALYRDNKVNPMSSCLPMLVQIPVFIALFNVLRSAVELRYASFLWIADLSEPEGLLSAYLPFGGINILPILMAATMALQTALTPSTGDKNQQKMMMVFMPIMMLVMFYNFPSALSLYWTLSQVLSIVQMWMIRRRNAATK